jgi:hypothetical protein
MSKNTVLVVGIIGVVVLMTVGLLTGHNGALLASSFAAIGAMVGFAFGHLGTSPPAASTRKFLALAVVAGLALGGCAGAPFVVEICVVHPEYGKICGTLKDGQVTITADVDLPPEVYAKVEDQIRKLAGD